MLWLVMVVTLLGVPASGVSTSLASQAAKPNPPMPRASAAAGGRTLHKLYRKVVTAMWPPALPMLVNRYEPDPNVRMEQLLSESEDLRQIHDEVRRFWMNDQPSHTTDQRVKGGIGP